MSTSDWTRFTVRIDIKADPKTLYEAWITNGNIEHWFLRWCEYKKPDGTLRRRDEPVQKGDSYSWRWHGYPDEVTEQGAILDLNGKSFFKFSFGKAGNCSVYIKEEAATTIVELIQENIPDDEHGRHYYHVGCKTGWTFHLADMKSIYEGGIDLRNKNEALKDMLNS